MKFHWCKYPADALHHSQWFVVGIRSNDTTEFYTPHGTHWWRAKNYLEKYGFILGPEIPGPPEG